MKKNKRPTFLALATLLIAALALFFTFASVKYLKCVPLEKENVLSFKIEQQPGKSPVELTITGVVGHSSFGVKDIETSQSGDTLHVKICLQLAASKKEGNIAYRLAVPDSVQKVVFGGEQTVIWNRAEGGADGSRPPQQ